MSSPPKSDIADTLADTFAEKFSPSNYSTSFKKFQNTPEKSKLNFKSNNNEHYNKDFTLKELRKALRKCNDTVVGCDDIHFQFLKHLPFRSTTVYFAYLIMSGILVFFQTLGRKL